jgi:HEAT repeat-containing protein 5
MVLTAAHCAKTLILAASSKNPTLLQCTKMLMPALIEYVISIAGSLGGSAVSEYHVTTLGEIWKAFLGFFGSVNDSQRMKLSFQLT